METLSEVVEEPKKTKQKRDLVDRRYWICNIFLFLFLLFVLLLSMFFSAMGWPPNERARITVENATGKSCYLALLSTDTDNYGSYRRSEIDDTVEYWGAMKDVCIARGMSEEEADQYVRDKKSELWIRENLNELDRKYTYEKYREVLEAYVTRMTEKTRKFYSGTSWELEELYPPYEDWKGIAAYQDPDGYRYIHQEAWKTQGDKDSFDLEKWCLPEQFKILLYWPEDGRYAVSDVWTRDHVLSEYRVTAETLPGETVARLQAVDESRSESVPWWIIAGALLLFAGAEVLIAFLCGARGKRQLLTIAITSTVLHAALLVIMVRSRLAIMIGGDLVYNALPACLAKGILFPVLEMPLYNRLLREKGKNSFEWYKYCEFTLFINWASLLFVALLIVGPFAIKNWLFA